jgi:hypothetical protein
METETETQTEMEIGRASEDGPHMNDPHENGPNGHADWDTDAGTDDTDTDDTDTDTDSEAEAEEAAEAAALAAEAEAARFELLRRAAGKLREATLTTGGGGAYSWLRWGQVSE